jgi:hypothetical protein
MGPHDDLQAMKDRVTAFTKGLRRMIARPSQTEFGDEVNQLVKDDGAETRDNSDQNAECEPAERGSQEGAPF